MTAITLDPGPVVATLKWLSGMADCQKKLAPFEVPKLSAERERRDNLRAFLTECRAKLTPSDVGMPATGRRRVPGLRRDEVAELVGVSADWYRWAETGHVRISAKLIARLASVLRLSPEEQLHLYRLALPELYEADNALRVSSQSSSSASAISSAAEFDEAIREVSVARRRFLLGSSSELHRVRPRIARSWERSRRFQVDPGRLRLAVVTKEKLKRLEEVNRYFLDAARPVLERLTCTLGSSHMILLSDADGVVFELAGDRQALRRFPFLHVEAGTDWSEMSAGTNGIGTALADRWPVQVIGPEHFSDGWQDMACSAAPVRELGGNRMLGVLSVSSNYRRLRPHILGYVIECALEIEENFANGYRSVAISDIA